MPNVPADIPTTEIASCDKRFVLQYNISDLPTTVNQIVRFYDREIRCRINNTETPSSGVVSIVRGQEFPNGVR